ncbi:hypothetical protein LOTGIDRAFT_172219 [Lottia gigantea]|uniref:Uncharacterized protein n=1 Tax=Lottia gigantea TaxID=225164 RepID=V4CJ44_LOTGI|nr:hypothetical protein LOTGIDRAFT_172219 [Lottia gigantea]ESP02225.1 hypothetical protein LOTGIDRAFT_172219 [Lottia gigantea]
MTDRCFWCFGMPAPVERTSRTTQTIQAPRPRRQQTRPHFQSVRIQAAPPTETTPLKGILKKPNSHVRSRRPHGYQLLLHQVCNCIILQQDPEDKRAAFMDLLANRYPAYADKIYSGTGTQSEIAYPLKLLILNISYFLSHC